MDRAEWAKKWIDTNYDNSLNTDSNVLRGVLSWKTSFPNNCQEATLRDIQHLLYQAIDNHNNYISSGRKLNMKGETDTHFGIAHNPVATLDSIKRTLKSKGFL